MDACNRMIAQSQKWSGYLTVFGLWNKGVVRVLRAGKSAENRIEFMRPIKQIIKTSTLLLFFMALAGIFFGSANADDGANYPLELYRVIKPDQFTGPVIAWSFDSQEVALGGAKTAVWNIKSGEKIQILEPTRLLSSGFFYDNNHLLVPSVSNPKGPLFLFDILRLWDVKSGNSVKDTAVVFPNYKPHSYADRLSISADGSTALIGGHEKSDIIIYSLHDSKIINTFKFKNDKSSIYREFALSPDGMYFAAGPQGNGTFDDSSSSSKYNLFIDIYNTVSGNVVKVIPVSAPGMFGAMAFSPDSKYLATSADTSGATHVESEDEGTRQAIPEPDHAITIWRISDGSRLASYPFKKAHQVGTILWSKSGNLVFNAMEDNTLRIWSPSDPDNEGIIFHLKPTELPSPSISPDGKYLAMMIGGKVKIFALPQFVPDQKNR